MQGLVSVIITTYKRPVSTLKKAVESVLDQTYSDLELIIVDDNPMNNHYKAEVKKYVTKISDERVKFIEHPDNKGACNARNNGITLSRGNYIAFLDDDDEWIPTKIELQLKKFINSEVGLVYCDANMITIKNNNILKTKIRANRVSGEVFEKLILSNFIGSTSFVMVRKEALNKCGYFNSEIKSAQDYELWLRIAREYKVDFVDIPLVNYFIHEEERISANVDNKIQGLEMLNDLNKSYLETNNKAFSLRKMKILPFYTLKYGFFKALSEWSKAVKIYPSIKKDTKFLLKIIYYSILKNKKSKLQI